MELWSFINKTNKQLIRFSVAEMNDDEFGHKYFFTDNEYAPVWVVTTEEYVKNAYKKFVHPYNCMDPETPSTDYINIEDYEIIKFQSI